MKQVIDLILNQPLMIAPTKLAAILQAIQMHSNIQSIEGLPAPTEAALKAQKGNGPVYLNSGVGVLPVHGSLVHRARGLDALSGLTSYAQLSNNYAELQNDPTVDEIILSMDSHGGSVNGAFDFADEIFESRGNKKITAIIDENAYSAGYLIASAADEIILTRTAGVGSIGVITAHVDRSEFNEKQGFKVTTLFAGARKNDLNPNEPISDEAREHLQEQLNTTYDLFVETVARNRALPTSAIRETEASYYIGEKAISVGLADKLQSAKQAVVGIVEENRASREKQNKGRFQRASKAMNIRAK